MLSVLAQNAGLFYTILNAILVACTAVGLVRGSSIVRAIVAGAATAHLLETKDARIRELTKERDEVRSSLDAAVSSNNGWRVAMEQLAIEVHELRDEVKDLRHRLNTSTKYISDLLLFIKRGDRKETPPTIPEELREDVEDSIRHTRASVPNDLPDNLMEPT